MPSFHTLDQIDLAGKGTVVKRASFGAGQAYDQLLATISKPNLARVQNYWSSGPTRYRQLGPDRVTPSGLLG